MPKAVGHNQVASVEVDRQGNRACTRHWLETRRGKCPGCHSIERVDEVGRYGCYHIYGHEGIISF